MTLLNGCFIAGMLILIVAARMEDSDELGDDAERMAWIDSLARKSRKGHRTSRSRYGVSGLQK